MNHGQKSYKPERVYSDLTMQEQAFATTVIGDGRDER